MMAVPQSRIVTIPICGCSCDDGLEWQEAKYPDDTINYAVSFGLWLENDGSNMISVLANPPDGLILVSPATFDANNLVTMRFRGGVAGTSYGVQVVAFLDSGEVISRVVYLDMLTIGGLNETTITADPTENYADSLTVFNTAILIGNLPVFMQNQVEVLQLGLNPIIVGGRPIFLEQP